MEFSRRNLLHVAIGSIAVPIVAPLAAPLAIGAAMAKDAYPSRPIHLVVGFPPGSAADITARTFGNGAEGPVGQTIVVEDKPGAGSKVAAEYVAHTAADGYTLFLASVSIVTDQAMHPDPGFNLLRDFAPVAALSRGAVIMVASPQSNLHSVADVIARAKAKPGTLLCATSGAGSSTDLTAVLFAKRAGIEIVRVPYPGSPQAANDVMAGRAAIFFSPASTVLGQIAAGKIVALATAATKRANILPDVPSMAEAGMPDFDASI